MDYSNQNAEQQARDQIDKKLVQAGWVIQDKKRLNLYESLGVAVREMDTDTGPADYMLFIDGKACAVLEAKREGKNLGEVYLQSRRYSISKTKNLQRWADVLPFTYEATNVEIRFCDQRDPSPRSRYLFHFHQPPSAKTNDDANGIPVIRMGNIIDGGLDFSDLKYLPKDHPEFPYLLLNDGDILFNRTNSAELVGKTAVFKCASIPMSLASYLIRVRVIKGIKPEFVTFCINSIYGKKWIKSCVSQNVGQANVNGSKLKSVIIPLPSPDEQIEIVRLVEDKLLASERLLREIRKHQLKADRNKQSILSSAFSGRFSFE
jgi:hypothetical protein